MTNEEAAKRLETRVHWDIEFICCDQEDFTENLDAIEMGAAALRTLDDVERWAEAHIKYWGQSDEEYYIGIRDGLIMAVDALHGEREWPKEDK